MQEIGKFRAERLFSHQINMKWTLDSQPKGMLRLKCFVLKYQFFPRFKNIFVPKDSFFIPSLSTMYDCSKQFVGRESH